MPENQTSTTIRQAQAGALLATGWLIAALVLDMWVVPASALSSPPCSPRGDTTMSTDPRVLEAVTQSLREIISLRDYLAAVEVGSKVAHDMLDCVEAKLLEIIDSVGEGKHGS
jgi:hypothetical protein